MNIKLENKKRLLKYLEKHCKNSRVVDITEIGHRKYWIVETPISISRLKVMFGGDKIKHIYDDYYLINCLKLQYKFGDECGLYHFESEFNVKGKTINELVDRLNEYGFTQYGGYIDSVVNDSNIAFIRVPCLDDPLKERFCEILGLDENYVGRLYDYERNIFDEEWGQGWFYFSVGE